MGDYTAARGEIYKTTTKPVLLNNYLVTRK
jgi:hypothetical protein